MKPLKLNLEPAIKTQTKPENFDITTIKWVTFFNIHHPSKSNLLNFRACPEKPNLELQTLKTDPSSTT